MKSFRQYYYLTEDEKSDRKFRSEANEAFDKLKTAINKAYEKGTWDELFTELGNGVLIIKSLDSPLSKNVVEFQFGPERKNLNGVFSFIPSTGEPVILLHMIPENYLDLEASEKVDYINRHIDRFRSVFVHEYTHYLDWRRSGHITDTIPGSGSGDVLTIDEYVNDPMEFNAHYQEAVSRLRNEAKQMIHKLDHEGYDIDEAEVGDWINMFVDVDAQKFVKRAMKVFRNYFIENLNSKNRKKLEKRLARFFNETLKPMFKGYV